MRRLAARALLVAAGALLLARPAPTATITVINTDGANEGFNDPTPLAPVGGNPGTTRGMQRLIAFQYAADQWGAVLKSDVEIRVAARFDPLPCSGSSAVLGQAGPISLFHDFVGAPFPNTWYHVALANSLAGMDLDPGDDDIDATFNSVFGAGCAFKKGFYYGLDGNADSATEDDFVSVILHELGHGLGFATFVNVLPSSCDGDAADGTKLNGLDDAFMRNLEDHSTGKLWPIMTDAERLTSSTDTGDLHWVGAGVVAAGGFLTGGRDPVSGHVEMYAPHTAGCSSVSHFSNALTPNELMEPFYTGPNHNILLTSKVLTDDGWSVIVCGDGVIDVPETCDDGNTTSGDGCSSTCRVEECHTCTGQPSACTPAGNGSPCNDNNACTQTATCQGGTCMGSNPIVCTPLDQCHDVGTCNPSTGQCSNPNKPDGTGCNDSDTCTTSDVCTGGVCAGEPTCIDHFLCYKEKTTSGTPKFVPVTGVSLIDQFETLTVDATKVKHLCTPANKNGGGIVDAATHLESYQIKPVLGSPKHVPQTDVKVTNQLGQIRVNTTKPDFLMVPTAKNLTTDPPQPGPNEVDHYKCYKIKITPGTPTFPKGITATVADQFISPAKSFSVLKPSHLCTPVNKNGSGIKHSTIHQMCYKVKPAVAGTKQTGLHVNNQFGLLRVDTVKEDLLCVPSLKEL